MHTTDSFVHLIAADRQAAPPLFQVEGALDAQVLQHAALAMGRALPAGLVRLWSEIGGVEFFETETILAPCSDPDACRFTQLNRVGEGDGIVFHEGLGGLTRVLPTGEVVTRLLDRDGHPIRYGSLADWYLHLIRAEYAARYGLS